jgi:hypothetical protein
VCVVVIHRDEALVMLRDACPSFRAYDVPSFPVDPHGFGDMAELSTLARHLVDLAEMGDAEEFPAVFAVVESLLRDGDTDTVGYVRTHLIEDIQNITSHRDVRVCPADFRAVLGPTTTDVWDEIDESWDAAVRFADANPDAPPRSRVEDHLDAAAMRREIQAMTREMPDGTLASPADVLRYEAEAHDAQIDRRNFHLRIVPITLIVVAIVICIIGMLIEG